MIPAQFEYVSARSRWTRRSRALADGGDDAKVIAGGQSLLPLLRLRLAYPELLVDVGGLDELRGVTDQGESLLIGARTTHYQVIRDPLVAAHCGAARPGGGDGRAIRRCATAAHSADPSLTRIRPATCRLSAGAGGHVVVTGPDGSGRSRRRTSSSTT